MSKYGETFLTKKRWYSTDLKRVEESIFQWAPVNNTFFGEGDHVEVPGWGLSLLGIINLEFLPWRLQVRLDKESEEVLGYRIGKRGY